MGTGTDYTSAVFTHEDKCHFKRHDGADKPIADYLPFGARPSFRRMPVFGEEVITLCIRMARHILLNGPSQHTVADFLCNRIVSKRS